MKMAFLGWAAALVGSAAYGAGPTATPASLSFAYQVNSTTLPAAAKLTVALPSGTSAGILMTVAATPAQSWLAVTPDRGYTPLALTVTVNPTGLAPGSYIGNITVSAPPLTPAIVPVVLSVSNPPSTLLVTSASANYAVGTSGPSLNFSYTTGANATTPATAELDVASSGDIIPFNVTAALSSGKGSSGSSSTQNWIHVNQPNQLPNTQTSGVALSGSYVPITVTPDPTLLAGFDPGSYAGSITLAANNAANGSVTVALNLVISAGQPSLTGIYPVAVVAAPAVNPMVTIYGDNFFSTSVVTLQQGTAPAITLSSTLLSRKVLQATINASLLGSPGSWTLSVTNPAPPNNPSQGPVSTTFNVISATQPAIISVVNAASYLPTALQTGTDPDPVRAGSTSVSPRQIISIFGQNLGPDAITSATPSGSPQQYPTSLSGVTVTFTVGATPFAAPILMVSNNQINAIVPVGVAAAIGGTAQVIVRNNGLPTGAFNVQVVAANPGMFTFGGLGQGQAAILNYDGVTGGYSINSSKAGAPRGSTILIYATGMGDLALQADGSTVPDGAVATTALSVADLTVRVDIAGQPAVVSYAGACPGAVAGLVQVNAVVPPTVATGAAVPITVSIGSAQASRRSQSGVTLVVK